MLGPPLLPRNLEASIRDLSSAKADIRASAVEDLVRHARQNNTVRAEAVPLLKQRLTDEHPRVRAAAAVALGDLDAADAVTSLLVAVEDDDPYVRQMAINALGEIGDARALPRLRRALKDSRPEVRYQTIIAFARVADSCRPNAESVPDDEVDDALFEASGDDDDAIAHIALRVAEERLDQGRAPDGRLVARARALVVGPQEEPSANRREPSANRREPSANRREPSANRREPSANRREPSANRRERASVHLMVVAAILLAKAGDTSGHDVIMQVVRGEKVGGQAVDKEDERAAVELAGELGLTQATSHLERRVWGAMRFVRDTCPFHARIALARMGHERAKKEISSELASSSREVLSGAVVSAGRARMKEARAAIAQLTSVTVDPELTREALAQLDGDPKPCEGYRTAPPLSEGRGRRDGAKR